jgi:hypothetical protein
MLWLRLCRAGIFAIFSGKKIPVCVVGPSRRANGLGVVNSRLRLGPPLAMYRSLPANPVCVVCVVRG